MPAPIKAVIDKMFSFYKAGIDLSGEKCAVISCFGDTDTSVVDGMRIPFERAATLLNWKMAGEVYIPGVLNIGDIDRTVGCKQAAAFVLGFFHCLQMKREISRRKNMPSRSKSRDGMTIFTGVLHTSGGLTGISTCSGSCGTPRL
mgnify:FL=1